MSFNFKVFIRTMSGGQKVYSVIQLETPRYLRGSL